MPAENEIAHVILSSISSMMFGPVYGSLHSACVDLLSGRRSEEEVGRLFVEFQLPLDPIVTIQELRGMEADSIPSEEEMLESSGRRRMRLWTWGEDKRLLAGILRFGLGNWSAISRFLGSSRSRSQTSQRWFRGLNPMISRDGWTSEQDEALLHLSRVLGTKSWVDIARRLGNRSDVQCRYRHHQLTRVKESEESEESKESKEWREWRESREEVNDANARSDAAQPPPNALFFSSAGFVTPMQQSEWIIVPRMTLQMQMQIPLQMQMPLQLPLQTSFVPARNVTDSDLSLVGAGVGVGVGMGMVS
jgi:hypothetical protein